MHISHLFKERPLSSPRSSKLASPEGVWQTSKHHHISASDWRIPTPTPQKTIYYIAGCVFEQGDDLPLPVWPPLEGLGPPSTPVWRRWTMSGSLFLFIFRGKTQGWRRPQPQNAGPQMGRVCVGSGPLVRLLPLRDQGFLGQLKTIKNTGHTYLGHLSCLDNTRVLQLIGRISRIPHPPRKTKN